MQDHPGAPGSARQRNPGTDGTAACGGAAVPLAPGVGPRPVPRRALAHALGAGPCPVRCRALALALGAEPPSVRCRVHGVAWPRWLWPGVRRPECAADHRPLAGSCVSRLLQVVLAPRSCRSRRSHLSDNPTPPPITCIPPYWRRPARRLPPRARASHAHATRAPRPRPPADNLFSSAMVSPLRRECGFPRTRERRPPHTPSPHGGEGTGG